MARRMTMHSLLTLKSFTSSVEHVHRTRAVAHLVVRRLGVVKLARDVQRQAVVSQTQPGVLARRIIEDDGGYPVVSAFNSIAHSPSPPERSHAAGRCAQHNPPASWCSRAACSADTAWWVCSYSARSRSRAPGTRPVCGPCVVASRYHLTRVTRKSISDLVSCYF